MGLCQSTTGALTVGMLLLGCAEDPTPPRPDPAPSVTVVKSANPTPSATTPPPPRRAEWKMLADRWVLGNPIPNFMLTDHEGAELRLKTLGDSYVMVGFIFTSCSVPKACPLTTQKMFETANLWKAKVKANAVGERKLHMLTLTFDPETDTPAVLKSYGEVVLRNHDNWTLATGPEGLMTEALPKMFGVIARDDGKGSIAHTVKAALLRPGLRSMKQWVDNKFEPKEVVELILRSP